MAHSGLLQSVCQTWPYPQGNPELAPKFQAYLPKKEPLSPGYCHIVPRNQQRRGSEVKRRHHGKVQIRWISPKSQTVLKVDPPHLAALPIPNNTSKTSLDSVPLGQ
jgi:hypothetical protein